MIALLLNFLLRPINFQATTPAYQSISAAIDPTLLPITADGISIKLTKSDKSTIALTSLIFQARRSHLSREMFGEMYKLEKAPHTAVIAAGYCLSYKVYEGFDTPPLTQHIVLPNDAFQLYLEAVQMAHSDKSSEWLVDMVQGSTLVTDPYSDEKGIGLLKKAVALAPNVSYAHYYLGRGYLVGQTQFQSISNAIAQYQDAIRSKPVMAQASFDLMQLDQANNRNLAEASFAKRAFMSALPDGFTLKPEAKNFLATVPD